ncbi:uncharacterized protein LOC123556020 [Mercenaria mercenaria]|uniref:uncharacterized protein LOC123556020 n=1 Tax=Mercenaria mercenaria TaxID=6596 RepID=UPI001E1DB65A|nr:uncharacterized protein LOC123556020 [Mercenaria mercenaria]
MIFFQTRCLPESHTVTNIAKVLREAVDEWSLYPNPPLVSDNASNMFVAAKQFETELHLGSFAHTLNLACGKALKLPTASRLLARMRRVVSYFHRITTAATILKDKQTLLQLPDNKLTIDVSTRWNSALDMISRFLEQQPAIYAALTSRELRGKEKDVTTLSESEITAAEELVVVLSPLKTATTALCKESVPTVSLIIPLQYQLVTNILQEKDNDTELIKAVKKAIVEDLSARYQNQDTRKELVLSLLLDPRFKLAPFLTEQEKMEAYYDLTVNRAISVLQAQSDKVKVKTQKEEPTYSPTDYTSNPSTVPPLPLLPK